MNVRFFCQTYPLIEGVPRSWSDVAYLYLLALKDIAQVRIWAVPQKGFSWSAIRNDRWSPMASLFASSEPAPTKDYVNIVVGPQEVLDHYWTGNVRNIAISTLTRESSDTLNQFEQVWIPSSDELFSSAAFATKHNGEGPLIAYVPPVSNLLRAALTY